MTRTGIAFLVLNVFLAWTFFAAASPVMTKRRTTQAAIGKLVDEREKLQTEVEAAELRRRELLAELAVSQAGHQRVLTNHRIIREELEGRVAETVDHLNDSNSRLANLKGTLAQAENEINARDAEVQAITTEIESLRVFGAKLDEESAALAAKLSAARKEAETRTASTAAGHERLAKLAERVAPADGDGAQQ